MKFNKILNKLEINNECQQVFNTFVPKFKKHFSKVSSTDIKPFLNTFHSLIRDHLTNCMADEDNQKFLSKDNNYDDFVMYVLYRLFALYTADHCSSEVTNQKLVTCLVLEEAIASKLQPIEMWKNDCAVKFNIPAEENDNQKSSYKLNKQKSTKSSEKSSGTSESSKISNSEEEKKSKVLTESSI